MKALRVVSILFLLSAPSSAAAPENRAVLPFIQDDYARSLEQARAKKRPIFIEAWAPW